VRKKQNREELAKVTLLSIAREMAMPRKTKSARDSELKLLATQATRKKPTKSMP